ncbi:hypothetical protein [Gordonia sp. NPDC003585]|uniref:hypothetical protein n=1 Tax=Gordonia sp. NPDC003585 TaxID=3154275 RepID=UPI0033BAA3FC
MRPEIEDAIRTAVEKRVECGRWATAEGFAAERHCVDLTRLRFALAADRMRPDGVASQHVSMLCRI